MENVTPTPAPAPEKRSLFETVVTSTPVMLTVVATFILGQSSSEMTKAQYQRASAGQIQSKVADQWAFFQAKRIRGTIYEATADLLSQRADPFTSETLTEAAQSLLQEIEATTKVELPGHAKLVELAKDAVKEQASIQAVLNPPADGLKKDGISLTQENVRVALDALIHYPVAKADDKAPAKEIDPKQKEQLDAILDDIRRFKGDKEIAPKSLGISTNTIEIAIENARANAARVNDRGRAIERVLAKFDELIDGQDKISREFQRVVRAHLSAMLKANSDTEAVQKLERRLERVRAITSKLQNDFKAARHTFTAFRYEDDARSNQDAAYLYEVKVLQSSARSDRHLNRSFGFMIAMLIAQVGVTIASVAIAMRRRVPWWLLAVMAGLSAILFGIYVFLELGPLM